MAELQRTGFSPGNSDTTQTSSDMATSSSSATGLGPEPKRQRPEERPLSGAARAAPTVRLLPSNAWRDRENSTTLARAGDSASERFSSDEESTQLELAQAEQELIVEQRKLRIIELRRNKVLSSSSAKSSSSVGSRVAKLDSQRLDASGNANSGSQTVSGVLPFENTNAATITDALVSATEVLQPQSLGPKDATMGEGSSSSGSAVECARTAAESSNNYVQFNSSTQVLFVDPSAPARDAQNAETIGGLFQQVNEAHVVVGALHQTVELQSQHINQQNATLAATQQEAHAQLGQAAQFVASTQQAASADAQARDLMWFQEVQRLQLQMQEQCKLNDDIQNQMLAAQAATAQQKVRESDLSAAMQKLNVQNSELAQALRVKDDMLQSVECARTAVLEADATMEFDIATKSSEMDFMSQSSRADTAHSAEALAGLTATLKMSEPVRSIVNHNVDMPSATRLQTQTNVVTDKSAASSAPAPPKPTS
jgi:hypothetical protein